MEDEPASGVLKIVPQQSGKRYSNTLPVIPGRKSRKLEILYDKTVYKLRPHIERLFGKIKENRRFALRYEKSDNAFLAFIAIAILKIYLC